MGRTEGWDPTPRAEVRASAERAPPVLSAATVRRLASVLGASLLAFGALKIVGGHRPYFSLSPAVFYVVAVTEVVLGALLLARLAVRVSAAVSGGMLLAAIGRRFVYGAGPCGCLGPLSANGSVVETAAAAVLLVVALAVLSYAPTAGEAGNRVQ